MDRDEPVFIDWDFFARSSVKRETGYYVDVLDYLYGKYSTWIILVPPQTIYSLISGLQLPLSLRHPKYFFLAYKYIHRYPARHDAPDVLGCSIGTLQDRVLPTLHCMATVFDEVCLSFSFFYHLGFVDLKKKIDLLG